MKEGCEKADPSQFQLLKVLGQGSYGKVQDEVVLLSALAGGHLIFQTTSEKEKQEPFKKRPDPDPDEMQFLKLTDNQWY